MSDSRNIKKLSLIQLIVRVAIFVIFFLGVFAKIPVFILYLLLGLILANLVIGFLTKKRSIVMNIVFLIMYPFLHVVLIEYIIILIGTVLSLIHALMFFLYYKKEYIGK